MKKIISVLLLIVLTFSLSACNKSNNTSSELDISTQSGISSIDISSQNNTTSNEDLKSEQSSSKEESKPQSSSESSSTAEESKPTETSNPSTLTHTHIFSNATCTEPKKCSCGATQGKALGHKWVNATCTAPKTCSVCKITEGNALGHKFSNGKCSMCEKIDVVNPKEKFKPGTNYIGYKLFESEAFGLQLTTYVLGYNEKGLFYQVQWYYPHIPECEPYDTITYNGTTFYGGEGSVKIPFSYKLSDTEIVFLQEPNIELFTCILQHDGKLKVVSKKDENLSQPSFYEPQQ